MRFAFITCGETLWLWQALQDEGHEVGVFHNQRGAEQVGRGMGFEFLPSLPALVSWVNKRGIVIIDFTHSAQDKVNPSLTAQVLHKSGLLTIGGGQFAEKLEHDREFGQQVAKSIGFKIPESHAFNKISEAIAFLYKHAEDGWHFKTDKYLESAATFGGKGVALVRHLEYLAEKYGDNQACHVEKTIEGPTLSVNAWFDGNDFVYPAQFTIEHKRLLDHDLGPNTGCSFNFCGPLDDATAQLYNLDKMAKALREHKALPGLYDVNTVVTKEGIYFLEWTPRFGYDSEPTILSQVDDVGGFLSDLAAGILDRTPWWGYSLGVRVTVPPYPTEEYKEKGNAQNVPVIGPCHASRQFAPYGLKQTEELETSIADPNGLVGVALDSRPSSEPVQANEEVLEFIRKELDVPNLQYRTDAGWCIATDIANLNQLGVEIPCQLGE